MVIGFAVPSLAQHTRGSVPRINNATVFHHPDRDCGSTVLFVSLLYSDIAHCRLASTQATEVHTPMAGRLRPVTTGGTMSVIINNKHIKSNVTLNYEVTEDLMRFDLGCAILALVDTNVNLCNGSSEIWVTVNGEVYTSGQPRYRVTKRNNEIAISAFYINVTLTVEAGKFYTVSIEDTRTRENFTPEIVEEP